MQRRSFLLLGLALLAAGCTPEGHLGEPDATEGGGKLRGRRVLIVGAGIAGIAAALDLRAQGADVQILEARDRVGGRTWTRSDLGFPMDMGAMWIEGGATNPVAPIARRMGARLNVQEEGEALVHVPSRGLLDDAELSELEDYVEEVLEFIEAAARNARAGDSVAVALRRKLAADGVTGGDLAAVRWAISSLIETDMAESIERISLSQFGADSGFDGDDLFVSSGYGTLAEALAEGLPVRLSEPVRSVATNGDGVTVTTSMGRYEGDAVLVTVSLGVLKAGAIHFDPALPAAKLAAISRLGMGVLNKVFLVFDRAFWPEDAGRLGVASAKEEELWTFVNLTAHYRKPVLAAFAGGEAGRWIDQASDDEVRARALQFLNTLFGTAMREPTNMVVTRWGKDPFSLGSYSGVPVGATMEDYVELATPGGDQGGAEDPASVTEDRGIVQILGEINAVCDDDEGGENLASPVDMGHPLNLCEAPPWHQQLARGDCGDGKDAQQFQTWHGHAS